MFREFLRYLSLELYRSPHTVAAYDADLRGFNHFMSQTGVIDDGAGCFIGRNVKPVHIREWMAEMSEEGISPRSIRRKLQSVRTYFKYLAKRDPGLKNPTLGIALPKYSKKLPEIARDTELIDTIESATSSRDRLIVSLLFGCGLRRAELLSLTDDSISLQRKELRVTGKGNKTRVLPLSDEVIEQLEDYLKERATITTPLSSATSTQSARPLFVTKRGPLSESGLYKIVKGLLGGTSASRKSPHTLRHTFATTLLNSGADINSVKELLGHSSLGATQIYTHVAFKDMKSDWLKAHPRSAGNNKTDKNT